ncbi:unnamed protein product [Acanthoscelides obtectus]|uniref:Uncharacterized protein n=1 Tax=Acanthoscelides obtectus TaxID=200917 RepID=A0A9P0MLN6_ACAOB|nr:unnamed protein product [Acanthoscelides obtectus]CAK1625380.1 hypothetical protein AOBTE_LOCUS3135 [Acanthoscelides obtectus]
MGNKLCKRKVDCENAKNPFDRLVNRLHLRPNAWKSDPQLSKKDTVAPGITSITTMNRPEKENIIKSKPISRSSDWTNVDLTVPDNKEEQHVHLRNPKLTSIFSRDSITTPVPPPRKHKKNFREKIEAVAKSGLQAFQTKKPVEEPLFVKKNISYKCPICDEDESTHNRNHHHHHHNHEEKNDDKINTNKIEENKKSENKSDVEKKRRKNLSVMSLPNYDELKFTVAHFDDIDKDPTLSKSTKEKRTSYPSDVLTSTPKKSRSGSTGKLDSYITRCRSISSLLPQHLKKAQHPPKNRGVHHKTDGDSDDSFGGLEDWDLGLIEHYNPKDASLPRPRKSQRNSQEVMAGIEDLIVKDDVVDSKPKSPEKRTESTVTATKKKSLQASPTLVKESQRKLVSEPSLSPSAKQKEKVVEEEETMFSHAYAANENGQVEHSSLLKILEKFTQENVTKEPDPTTENSSLSPSLLDFEKNLSSIEEFINAEKVNTDKSINVQNITS